MRGLPRILSLFRNEFEKFNKTGARVLYSILSHEIEILKNRIFGVKKSRFSPILNNVIMNVIT